LYYQVLWEIGAAQTDGANLKAENVNWSARLLSYNRQKIGQLCVLEIGSRLEALLKALPSDGPLFPKISTLKDKDRAAEFCRRCRILKIKGISLHSYRYAWASRAKQLGMPERFAQNALASRFRRVRAYPFGRHSTCVQTRHSSLGKHSYTCNTTASDATRRRKSNYSIIFTRIAFK
jgi:hypothetical protein